MYVVLEWQKRDSIIWSGSDGCIPATASAEKVKSSGTQTATEATPRNHLRASKNTLSAQTHCFNSKISKKGIGVAKSIYDLIAFVLGLSRKFLY